MSLRGVHFGGKGYLTCKISKKYFAAQYPLGTTSIPERFPSLSSRLLSMPRSGLLDQLGRGQISQLHMGYPFLRDQLVLTEFFEKGPVQDEEVCEIIVGNPSRIPKLVPADTNSRLGALVAVLEETHRMNQYAAAIGRCFLNSPSNSGLGPSHMDTFMWKAGSPAVRIAIELLRRPEFAGRALMYLDNRVQDPDTLKALVEARVADGLNSQRDALVEKARRRIDALNP
jgi:hypothetical protein